MAQKIILSERQHEVIVNHILNEMVDTDESLINEDGTVNEGVWEKIKYGLSKLGRYKAGGKIFGKGKIDQEAGAKIQAIIDKKGNEVIKALDAKIKETNPEFPNNEKGVQFLSTIMDISAIYDSVVASTQKNPKDEGYLPIDAANGIINDLREYVKKFLDVDLTAAYSVVDEAEGNTLNVTEEELKKLDESWDLNENILDTIGKGLKSAGKNLRYSTSSPDECEARAEEILRIADSRGITDPAQLKYLRNLEINNCRKEMGLGPLADWNGPGTLASRYEEGVEDVVSEDEAGDVRKALQAKRGQGDDFDSERMSTLKSNKLPMTLVGVGASLGAFSWLVNTEWFKHLFDTVSHTQSTEMINQTIEQKSDIFGQIKPGQGMTQLMNSMNNAGLSPNSTPDEFLNQVKILGGGNLNDGINALAAKGGIFANPDQARGVLMELAKNPHGHGSTLGQVFQSTWAGTGKHIGDTLVTVPGGTLHGMIVKTLVQAVPKIVIRTTIKTGAGYAVAKGLGSVLGPIGVGLLAAGALVKIMRMKGQKQSRAKTLNDLYQSMRNIEGGTGIIEPDGPTIDKDEAQDPDTIENKNKQDGEQDGGNKDGGTTGKGGFNDELYNTLRNMFQFVVNNRKKLGTRAADNVGTGGATLGGGKSAPAPEGGGFKKGDKATYKGRNVTVTVPDVSPGYTQIDGDGDGPEKKTYAVKTADLQKQLSEGKYIIDKRLVQFLQKNLSMDKLKSFEEFIGRVERIRTLIKKAGNSGDKVLDGKIKKMDSNPIMVTDFVKMFNVDSTNPQAVNALKAFIDDIFITLYSGKYKFDSMIDKMSNLGGGNVNKLEEEKGYSAAEPNKAFLKDAQDRGRFKKNLLNFLTDSIGIFQYLYKLKMQAEKGGKKSDTGKKPAEKTTTPTATPPSTPAGDTEKPEAVAENTQLNSNPLLTEEVERIKKIMKGLI
jgi:hypothetical protein